MTDSPSAKAQFSTAAALIDQVAQHERDVQFVKSLEGRFEGGEDTWDAEFESLPSHLQKFFDDFGEDVVGFNPRQMAILLAATTAGGIRMAREGQP